ncbi:MAG: alpha/beta fold hydrolase [Bacteroidota bacterium]|jgi:dipeptidyl aminopeptidase/acylaminoacyl peptidase
MKLISLIFLFSLSIGLYSQNLLTPEELVQLGKVSGMGISKDGKSVIYTVRNYDLKNDKASRKYYLLSSTDEKIQEIKNLSEYLTDYKTSNDKQYRLSVQAIKIKNIYGSDFYPDLKKSDVMIFESLNNRHWDTWEDGIYDHVFLHTIRNGKTTDSIDLIGNEPFDCPQKPFGGDEDYIFSPDEKKVIYVCKKKFGTQYAVSTNTDIYSYDIESKTTTNLTDGMQGYDIQPAYSLSGNLAFLSMKTDGYESDKNDIVIMLKNEKINLTKDWDGTVNQFKWSLDGKKIYFVAPVDGTEQLFEVTIANEKNKNTANTIKQITNGNFDIRAIVGQIGNNIYVERTDMNHAAEIFSVDLKTGQLKQLTHVNDEFYSGIRMGKIEKKYFTATDGKKLLSWIIYPPDFDPNKKYPTLLYCQGGPQSALSQFYSFRWNFQLMAANGYIIVAPNRRGMPGHGVAWNEQISLDYGGQNMKDYLTAIDEMAKEPYVDINRLGCVGASYGGYSGFYLAGIHGKRFKSFICHDGIFDWRSMYGTTEELFFVNHDLGGPYWEKSNPVIQKSYNDFNPVNYVEKWNAPMLIIQGGTDFRVPIEQGLQAFQAAQLRGLKSKLLYFPNENHWILKEQNSVVWQREFFGWLKETLK